eukprot:5561824-Prymnesium_polylepis.1
MESEPMYRRTYRCKTPFTCLSTGFTSASWSSWTAHAHGAQRPACRAAGARRCAGTTPNPAASRMSARQGQNRQSIPLLQRLWRA